MSRFESLEKELAKKGKSLGEVSLEEMDEIWDLIKEREI
jgi:uncharacterized protein YabN with tetrapyrrole methylase and pyrophosphatase domain